MIDFLLAPYGFIARYRRILWTTSRTELRSTYAGSLLGLFWLLLGPLLLLVFYAAMFLGILRINPNGMTGMEYLLFMGSGLIPFIAFSASLTMGAGSLMKNQQALLNLVFPAELIPVRAVLVSSAVLPVGIGLLCIAAAFQGKLGWSALLLPLLMALQLLFTFGLIWILSLATLVLRDIQFVLQYVNMVLIIVSPISFQIETVPAMLKPFVHANPLAYFIVAYQSLLVRDALPPAPYLLGVLVLGAGSAALGFWVFRRAKKAFLDYV